MVRRRFAALFTLSLGVPALAGAVGLGDIHLASALNEPLSAQIDIVGASDEDLQILTANVADRGTFERYAADRPAFLSSLTFRVTHDSRGRPILAVRSADPFTDPLVRLLIDLKWGRGEVIKEYSLLLDPAGAADSAPLAEAAPVALPRTSPSDP
jgi:pilus assembly protein FimV